jgi:hypothetical protein
VKHHTYIVFSVCNVDLICGLICGFDVACVVVSARLHVLYLQLAAVVMLVPWVELVNVQGVVCGTLWYWIVYVRAAADNCGTCCDWQHVVFAFL